MQIPCQYCDSAVPFEEADRGGDVYCPSCGRANLVPLESDAAACAQESVPASSEQGAVACELPGTTQAPPPVEDGAPPPEPASEVPASPSAEPSQAAAASRGAAEAKASAAQEALVFSMSGLIEAGGRMAGEETCLCGVKILVRVEDYGGSVYCPSCGTEIHVGPTLDQEKYRAAETAARPPSAAASESPPPASRFRRVCFQLGATVAIILSALVAIDGYRMRQSAEPEVEATETSEPKPTDAAKADRPQWTLTLEDIDKMLQARDPAVALIGARRWLSWLRRNPGVEKDDPRPARLALVIEKLEKQLAPPITSEMIEKLLRGNDPAQALVQAQMWQESLRDEKVAAGDPRLVRLAKVVEELMDRLAPKPQPPPPYLADFQKVLQQIADKLKEENAVEGNQAVEQAEKLLDQAGQLIKEAEQFLQTHPDELAPYGRRLLLLKAGFARQKGLRDGVRRLREWFGKAAENLAAGKVTDGLSFLQRARFCGAFRTQLRDDEIHEFEETVKRLAPEVRFARGKRAVDDALACDRAKDSAGRDREARQAAALLPGLPESRIRPLLEQVQQWSKDATAAARPRKPASDLARSIERRDLYETAMERYGDGQWQELVSACLQVEALLSPGDPESENMHARMGVMLFDVLEMVVGNEFEAGGAKKEQAKPLEQLSAVRRWLDQLSPWKSDGRWKALDAVLRQAGDEKARKALDRAVALAAEDRLTDAVAEAAPAETLGNPATCQRAKSLSAQWQAEIKLRADRQAEQQQWDRIQALIGQKNAELELYSELRQFRQRFPKGPHAGQLEALLVQTNERVQRKGKQTLQEIEELIAKKQWAKARTRVELLRLAPLPAVEADALQRLQKRFDQIKAEAGGRFLLLSPHVKLLNEGDVLALLAALPEILEMDPGHEEARTLLDRARRQGAVRAHQLIGSALPFKNQKRKVYEEKLGRAAALDPEGPDGKRARELLNEG